MLVQQDEFTVQHGVRKELRLDHELRECLGKVRSMEGDQLDFTALLHNEDSEAVVLEFIDPPRAGKRFLG